MGVVRFPPSDATGWCHGLLTDLAWEFNCATELFDALHSVRRGELAEWSMCYNAYEVELHRSGATISFMHNQCSVPLELLAEVIASHLAMLSPDDGVG